MIGFYKIQHRSLVVTITTIEEEKNMARTACYEFLRDLRGTVFGNRNRSLAGKVVTITTVATEMNMTVSMASRYLWFAEKYGLIKRKCGGYVI